MRERSRVEQFEAIRRGSRDRGMSIRALAKRHGVHRRTVRQALADATPRARKLAECWLRPPANVLILFGGG
jgi:lambda repressor-like predicted transcriptional regulator